MGDTDTEYGYSFGVNIGWIAYTSGASYQDLYLYAISSPITNDSSGHPIPQGDDAAVPELSSLLGLGPLLPFLAGIVFLRVRQSEGLTTAISKASPPSPLRRAPLAARPPVLPSVLPYPPENRPPFTDSSN